MYLKCMYFRMIQSSSISYKQISYREAMPPCMTMFYLKDYAFSMTTSFDENALITTVGSGCESYVGRL